MKVFNKLSPNDEQLNGFVEGDVETPIAMVNLLKFKEKAEYEDGRDTNLSGVEAYAVYAEKIKECLKKVGGEIVFSGEVSRLMLGEVDDLWDSVAIARYPSRKAMLAMIMDPHYQEIEKHRSAGLEGQLNIETKDL